MRFLPLLLFPLFLFAQKSKPAPAKLAASPAAADRALRERATAFLQCQVDGNFRKAYDLVAEDSKDFYFAVEKIRILSFKIDEVTYTGDFAKATVRATAIRKTNALGHEFEVPSGVADSWKLERGKWVWYHDPNVGTSVSFFSGLTGGGTPQTPSTAVDPKVLPPKDTSPESMAAAAAKLIQPTSFSKASLQFTEGKAGTEELVFHNGNRGQIKVTASVEGDRTGITIEPAETPVNALADLTIKVHYDPSGTSQRATNLRFEIQPFRSVFVLPVTIVSEAERQRQ